VVSAIFESHRVERIAAQGFANDSSNQLLPGLLEVMEVVSGAFFSSETVMKFNRDYKALALMAIQSVLINRYLAMAYNIGSGTCERFSSLVSSQAMHHLNSLDTYFYQEAYFSTLQWQLHANYLKVKKDDKKPFMSLPIAPQGSPI